jgi:mRNA turnover protein 4
MPRSSRAKLVSLTKTKPDRKAHKGGMLATVREACETFSSAYALSFANQRASALKELRATWSDSRFVIGKNRLMQLALGETPDTAHRPGMDSLAGDLHGQVGLLFTNRPRAEVEAFFAGFCSTDFARAGFVPAATLQVPPGRLPDLPHTMLDQLRKLGMPCNLDRGVIVLPQAYTLCRAGTAITPEQGRLLKHFGHALAEFRITLLSCVQDGAYAPLASLDTFLAHRKAVSGGAGGGAKGGSKGAKKRRAVKAGVKAEEEEEEEEEEGEEEEEEEEGME